MPKPVAIVDTSFLIYCLELKQTDLLRKLRILFDHLLLPEEIIREFSPNLNRPENQVRNQLLKMIRLDEGFYRKCTSLDRVIMTTLLTDSRVDKGEAEVISQSQARKTTFVLIDEKRALKSLRPKFSHLRFYNTLTIIAILDLLDFIPDYPECMKGLYEIRKFKAIDIRLAFEQAMEHTQMRLTKKQLSHKTSMRRILV